MIILGLDPGIERLGWGLVECERGKYSYIDCGCIKTPRGKSQSERLSLLSRALVKLIKDAKPDRAHIEKLFFAKNKKTALGVAEARGAILKTLFDAHLAVREFTPLEVKMSLTGNGRAEKRQVAWMVRNILKIREKISSDDALDALALSIMMKNEVN
ncbi:MAG: crossover junction endodeoxyribonuclease RuvC [Candidatus Ryanbacteria bacterium]|nr:crossover junction endodeoxyribonuclease RuvC [Candidatus Ryanbacteria bacterium]